MPRSPVADALRRTPVLVFAVGAGLLLAGCGSSSSNATPPAAAPSSAAPTPSSAASAPASAVSSASAGTTVTATETDFKIALSQQTFSPGSYTFKATNSGKVPHALTIVGPGVSSMSTSAVSPGQSANLTVTLQSGSYEIYCPVDSHKSLGMDLHITVGS
jgi:plastocyanin